MSRYAVVIERTKTGFSAYVPDLPGCVGTAKTRLGVQKIIREAITLHLQGMREDGVAVPKPSAEMAYVEFPTAATRRRAG